MDTQLVTPAPKRLGLELDLIADFACPWSYLGKRSLERALGNLHGFAPPALRWHGFRPQAQAEKVATKQLASKVLTRDSAGESGDEAASVAVSAPQTWRAHMASRLPAGISVDFAQKSLAEAGEGLGIHFDFSRLQQVPDTREAHRLMALASREDKQSEVADGIFRAFFEQGRDIGDHAVIEAVGQETGLGAETLAAFNKPEEGRDEIAAEEQRLRGFGVVATPNLLINGRVLVPGPADVSTYVQALDQALFPKLPSDKKHLH
jgi:predicted DsbA family dithiol-disulfide isomerase